MTDSVFTAAVRALSLFALVAVGMAAEPARKEDPDVQQEVLAFTPAPPAWSLDMLNVATGIRPGEFVEGLWPVIDYVENENQTACATNRYLIGRGIPFEQYGCNEYQEAIKLHEAGTRALFWENGVARNVRNEQVISEHYNRKRKWGGGFDAAITCGNAPRWWALLNYDFLQSPAVGYSMQQDNIGSVWRRVGSGSQGRFCDFCGEKFTRHLRRTGRCPDFVKSGLDLRSYILGKPGLAKLFRELPPYKKFSFEAGEPAMAIAREPVMAEYMKFFWLSHMHNWIRFYRDQKRAAGTRPYAAYGNLGGGGMPALQPYGLALSEFVDVAWLESGGLSLQDLFRGDAVGAWGPLKWQLLHAFCGNSRAMMSTMSPSEGRHTAVSFEHELAETCAGGGTLFVGGKPGAHRKTVEAYARFRYAHHGVFSLRSKRTRLAQVGVVYSVPTMLYQSYIPLANTPAMNNLAGIARTLEECRMPYDIVLFHHPDLRKERVTAASLQKYRLLILPAVECISDVQAQAVTAYLRNGGTLGTLDRVGRRDENNRLRSKSLVNTWKKAGRVVSLLDEERFPYCRARYKNATAAMAKAMQNLEQLIGARRLLSASWPARLWVKSWVHDARFLSLHFVNYQITKQGKRRKSSAPFPLTVSLPAQIPAEEARWLTPGAAPKQLKFELKDNSVTCTIPAVDGYGVLVIGRKEAEQRLSLLLAGDHLVQRLQFGGHADVHRQRLENLVGLRDSQSIEELEAYGRECMALLKKAVDQGDAAFLTSARGIADAGGVLRAFDFGAEGKHQGWQAVRPATAYTEARGYGWLPAEGEFKPVPSEEYYRYTPDVEKLAGINQSNLPPWPYDAERPASLGSSLWSCRPRTFRVQLPAGRYRVKLVSANAVRQLQDMLVSGTVLANGEYRLLDTPLAYGDWVEREFRARVGPDEKLDLTFGAATPWSISQLRIYREEADAEDTAMIPVRTWRVSPVFANPAWRTVEDTSFPPDTRLDRLQTDAWAPVQARPRGLPVVDLDRGDAKAVGDTVFAAATLTAAKRKRIALQVSASSGAMVYLNGEKVGVLPNQKGLRRGECVIQTELRAGPNVLVLKLGRFWERRWLFMAEWRDQTDQ